MKALGLLLIIVFSTSSGILKSEKTKQKVIICDELLYMAELMKIRLKYLLLDSKRLLRELAENDNLSHLTFLSDFDLERRQSIQTSLSGADNKIINELFSQLGKSDLDSQCSMIEAFSARIRSSRKMYDEEYKKYSKLYLAFGVSGGVILAVLLI